MSHNPYAPPTAAVADVDLSAESAGVPPFFAVSLLKLTVMSLCTFGFYELYWFYKNWQLIRAREQSNISPVLRTFFGIIYCYSCFSRIRERGEAAGITPALSAGVLATGWILTTLTWKLPAPYPLISVLAVAFLIPVQAHANRINEAIAPGHQANGRFSGWNWLIMVIGGLLLAFSLIGLLAPAA